MEEEKDWGMKIPLDKRDNLNHHQWNSNQTSKDKRWMNQQKDKLDLLYRPCNLSVGPPNKSLHCKFFDSPIDHKLPQQRNLYKTDYQLLRRYPGRRVEVGNQ